MSAARRDRFLQLRNQARALLAQSSAGASDQPPELRAIVEEMQVLQTELELQAEELRIAQSDTEEARRHYFALFDDAPVAFVLLDGHENIVELNQRGMELIGLSRRPERTVSFTNYLAAEDHAAWTGALAMLGQGQRTIELRMRQARNASFVAQCKLSRWVTPSGAPGFLVGLVDVTALRDAERERASLAEKYEALFDSSRDGILLVDAETRRVIDANPRMCILLGATRRQLVGRDRDELLSPARAALDGLKLAEQLRSRGGMPAEIVLQRHDETQLFVDVVVSPMATGGRVQHVLFVRDASVRLELEREKARVAEGLLRARQLDSVGQLAAGVAHDMNNTLAALAGAVTELEQASLAPHLAEAVSDIAKAMRSGSELTTSLLVLGRDAPMRKECFDLGGLLTESARLLTRILPKTLSVELTIDPKPMMVLGDAAQWSRVIMNLSVNARDAMPGGGVIRISGVSDGASAHLCFADDGVGMSDAVRRRAFEPFFTTKAAGEGTGLGLAHVYSVAGAHGATVELESAVGKGTKVRFVVPLVPESEHVAPAARPSSGKLEGRALVVDDDPRVRRSTCRLVSHWGLTPMEAATGAAALEVLEGESPPEFVICDLAMPGMNGADVAERVRERWPAVRVIIVTGHADEPARARLTRLGVALVAKPFTKDDLHAALVLEPV
jgi:PAS domain S-box-containing protein